MLARCLVQTACEDRKEDELTFEVPDGEGVCTLAARFRRPSQSIRDGGVELSRRRKWRTEGEWCDSTVFS